VALLSGAVEVISSCWCIGTYSCESHALAPIMNHPLLPASLAQLKVCKMGRNRKVVRHARASPVSDMKARYVSTGFMLFLLLESAAAIPEQGGDMLQESSALPADSVGSSSKLEQFGKDMRKFAAEELDDDLHKGLRDLTEDLGKAMEGRLPRRRGTQSMAGAKNLAPTCVLVMQRVPMQCQVFNLYLWAENPAVVAIRKVYQVCRIVHRSSLGHALQRATNRRHACLIICSLPDTQTG
jgi:hypothetical protein